MRPISVYPSSSGASARITRHTRSGNHTLSTTTVVPATIRIGTAQLTCLSPSGLRMVVRKQKSSVS